MSIQKPTFFLSVILSTNCFSAINFSITNYGAADSDETDAFNRINSFRADPQNELYEMFQDQGYAGSKTTFDNLLSGQSTHTANWWKNTFGSNLATNSMDSYQTVPATLKSQFDSLPAANTLNSYTWNDNIGWAAHQYSTWIENDAGTTLNPHYIPGAPSLGDRFSNAGVNWTSAGENVASNWPLDPALMHMGFAIDWGIGTDGIQDPAGHRDSMLNASFTSIGIALVDKGWDAGSYTQVQHLANVFATDPIFYGYVTDLNTGAENSGIIVTVYDSAGNPLGTATTDARGAYTIEYTGGTPDYATFNDNGSIETSNVALGNSGTNYFLDAAIAVPEPSSTLLIGLGSLALISRRKK